MGFSAPPPPLPVAPPWGLADTKAAKAATSTRIPTLLDMATEQMKVKFKTGVGMNLDENRHLPGKNVPKT